MSDHNTYMHRAIELAKLAEGCTSPNPLVGCVVVNNGSVVGSGWHRGSGQAHAEVNALEQAGELCRGATLYVSLEPCCHHGKTPPCTDAIIASGITQVIYATADTNNKAMGGAALLRQAGIDTVAGVLQQQARELNRFYFHHLQTGQPYVIAKFAASLDGRIASRTRNSQWITGEAARAHSHQLRQAVDAVVVGVQTVISDNPRLTVRSSVNDATDHQQQTRQPLRIVLDSHGRIPLQSQLLSAALPGDTLLVTTPAISRQRREQLQQRGVELLFVQHDADQRVDLPALLPLLGDRGIQSLMVEGGPTVLGSFFDAQQVQEVWAYLAPMLIGGLDAPCAIGGLGIDQLDGGAQLTAAQVEKIGRDFLIKGQLEFGSRAEN